MDLQTLEASLELAFTPGIGPGQWQQLTDACGGAAAALAALRAGSVPLPPRFATALRAGTGQRAAREALAWLDADSGNHLLLRGHPRYPALLAATEGAPVALFVRGDPSSLLGNAIAVVGARRASPYALDVARWFGHDFARAGVVVVSGLALGVDGAAHEATLAAGGATVAVAGTGLDRVYPKAHAALADRIAACGCLVSEFPLGTEPRAEHFPRRNRVLSGLSRAVVVVEGRRRSGSLVTARLAAEQGREVFAVPGSVFGDGATGTHALLREGATPALSAASVLEDLGLGAAPVVEPTPAAAADNPVLEALGSESLTFDSLARRCGLTAAPLSSILASLELAGRVERDAAGRYARAKPSP